MAGSVDLRTSPRFPPVADSFPRAALVLWPLRKRFPPMGRRIFGSSLVRLATLLFVGLASRPALAADEAGVEFFEKNVRPVLVQHCYECHGPDKQEANLQVDTVGGMLRGGDQGPAVVPGDPDASLLVKGLRYDDIDFQMPPKGKLAAEKIAAIEKWIKSGAAAPADEKKTAAAPKKKFDLAERAKHWCFQPLAKTAPPAVRDTAWAGTDVDRYILAKLEAAALKPAAPADKRTLIRRVYFDLTGLPPKPAEVEAFVADASPEAFEKVVDRLLASPRFGERWARHWLDLVRYAESRGHEFDYTIPNAYQYRDYVIRALNADVPYDRFVVEHLAGDLVATPRLNPETGANESILGTGFWFLGEECHSPVDIRQDETDRVDNKIDVMSKTFLGLTLACARCHDHKFDALSTKDYYALSGFVLGMSYRQAPFEAMEHNRKIYDEVKQLEAEYRPKLLAAQAAQMKPMVGQAEKYLLAVREARSGLARSEKNPNRVAVIARAASSRGLDEKRLTAWVEYFDKPADPQFDPLHAWRRLMTEGKNALVPAHRSGLDDFREGSGGQLLYVPGQVTEREYRSDGLTYGTRPKIPGDVRIGIDPNQPIERIYIDPVAAREPKWDFYRNAPEAERETTRNNWQQSGRTLKTGTSTLQVGRVWYLVRGSGRIYAAVDSHRVNNGPLHGQLVKQFAGPDVPTWISHDLTPYIGHRVHFEFTPLEAGELKDGQSDESAVMMVMESASVPTREGPLHDFVFVKSTTVDVAKLNVDEAAARLAAGYATAFTFANQRIADDSFDGPYRAPGIDDDRYDRSAEIAAWMIEQPELFGPLGETKIAPATEEFMAKQAALFAKLQKASRTAPVAWEGSGVNEHVLIRGNHRTAGELVERRFLEAIDGPAAPQYKSASGRLELAERLLDRRDPLPARVMVNRLWQHLFGRGLVATVDNFGIMGEAPTHPELLDHLAGEFMTDGWSLKRMLRKLALSNTYRMASTANPETAAKIATTDAENKLWHRALSKRLEAEAIRDAILAVSGRLDEKMYGPSVATFLTPFMEGRGRPGGGPVDGAGRRSVYLSVRRNFLNPMFQAFDYPTPFTSVGRRSNSNVPAQALSLMNGEFVRNQALQWAERTLKENAPNESERIDRLYETALARKPTPSESLAASEFLFEQRDLYGTTSSTDVRPWSDLCHVLFNVKEFIYLR
jgi:mono/diheme cytochrome c family protein